MDKKPQTSSSQQCCVLPKKVATETKIADEEGKKAAASKSASKIAETSNNDAVSDVKEKVTDKLASPEKSKKIPIINQQPDTSYKPEGTAVPRTKPPLPAPVLTGRPIVLATHLVPSLPITLFEALAEAIEAATNQPVVLLHESRTNRPVARDVTDIAILPAGEDWEEGNLLPVSFVFEHHLNKNFSPAVYADVVVATDRAPHVENIMDLRGHRCALPDRRRAVGVATLLFNQLRAKGEGPAFFGNTLDANSQMSALQMVAGKQVEVCILESPVIKYHRKSLPGVYSLHILSSLGPLPPYPIFVNKNMSNDVVNKIKEYLINIRNDTEWMEKLAPYGVLGFAEYSKSLYDFQEMKTVATSAPYY
ncbi:hypothetical protein TSAR_010422 [Trichomalopsis sarcophagae]|uniref:Solute-binding protein family 3/N-terminal domain-containing protein n=1 Tax=Trichomalopsis sarcophagae TaxID=543379 RepID=A0A232EM87_9HYME|nr:hypothetical protein TSAR_010422 [Trichomalopsis sarcophagae]